MSQHTQGSSTPTRPNDLAKRCHVGAKPGQCNVQVDCDRTRFQAKVQPYLWSRGRTAMKTKLSSYSFPDGWPCSFSFYLLQAGVVPQDTSSVKRSCPSVDGEAREKLTGLALKLYAEGNHQFWLFLSHLPKVSNFVCLLVYFHEIFLKCQKIPSTCPISECFSPCFACLRSPQKRPCCALRSGEPPSGCGVHQTEAWRSRSESGGFEQGKVPQWTRNQGKSMEIPSGNQAWQVFFFLYNEGFLAGKIKYTMMDFTASNVWWPEITPRWIFEVDWNTPRIHRWQARLTSLDQRSWSLFASVASIPSVPLWWYLDTCSIGWLGKRKQPLNRVGL